MKTITDATHFMLDLETLSTKTDALIIQIGAVLFTRYGIQDTKKVDLTINYPKNTSDAYHIDYNTCCWWMQQDKEVAKTVFGKGTNLKEGLEKTMELALEADYYWAKSSPFDFPILRNALAKENVKSNISFRYIIDMRDIYYLNPGYPRPKGHAGKHNGYLDAMAQAEYVITYLKYKSKQENQG